MTGRSEGRANGVIYRLGHTNPKMWRLPDTD